MDHSALKGITTGTLRPEETWHEARLRAQAFQQSIGTVSDQERPAVAHDRTHVARSGGTVVAAVHVIPFGQWFGGVSVPMGGVAGVTVAPEARGAGLARRLLGEAILAMYERGEVISALYPTTSQLYRSMGYEFAGRWERTDVEISSLAGRGGQRPGTDFAVEALESGRLQRMRPLYDRLASQANGWLDRGDLFWERLDHGVDPGKANSFGYVLGRDGKVEAGLTVTHRPGDTAGKYGVDVGGPFAVSAEAAAGAFRLIAGLGTMADRATFSLPVEQLALSLPGARLTHRDSWLWMLRLIDVGGALTSRAYNPAITADVVFAITDDVAPWNQGRWSLTVAGGTASAKRLEAAPGTPQPSGSAGDSTTADSTTGDVTTGDITTMDITALSGMYTGFLNPSDLAMAGRLPGASPETIGALTAVFAGPPSRLVDFF